MDCIVTACLNDYVFLLQSRLRKQDVGLKTHLQQLDQQINELKLDVSKASTEQLESDSRPSSGQQAHTLLITQPIRRHTIRNS